jgi:hypothetical protein
MRALNIISFGILLFSVTIYVGGRVIIEHGMSDDTADWFLWSGGISLVILFCLQVRRVKREAVPGIMPGINIGLGVLILFFGTFGLWGIFTAGGRSEFPEMSGLIPFYTLLFSVALLIILIAVNLVLKRK